VGGRGTPLIHAMMFRVFPINYDVKKNLQPHQCRDVKVGASKNNKKKDGSEEKQKEIDRVKRFGKNKERER
jgi:hypothetical protein